MSFESLSHVMNQESHVYLRNLKKIYIPKFQRSKLSKFIPNLPPRHVITSTYSFFVGIIGTFYEPCVILQIYLNIKTFWWWFFVLLKDYKTTSVLMPFILAGSSGVCLIYHLPTVPVFSYLPKTTIRFLNSVEELIVYSI